MKDLAIIQWPLVAAIIDHGVSREILLTLRGQQQDFVRLTTERPMEDLLQDKDKWEARFWRADKQASEVT